MGYRSEFMAHGKYLFAASIGMALGLALNHYVMSLFAPAMIAEFGWSRSQYALVGATPFILMFFFPLAGRFTDRVGPRKAAAVGFASLPIGYLALSFMNGSFPLFFAILVFKSLFGVLTTTMVFARVIVERFDHARGISLSIVMSGAPLVAAFVVPMLAGVIEEYGWRNGYRVLALVSIAGACISLPLLGDGKPRAAAPAAPRRLAPKLTGAEMRQLFTSPAFAFAIGGMFLVNIPQLVVASQLNLVLSANGATSQTATWIVSIYAIGVAVGRVLCGLALDRFAVHNVSILVLGLPALGLAALASPLDETWLLAGSILLMALAQGAEGDIGAFLISRKFALRNYSLITSLMTIALTVGSASGSVMLSYTLATADSYDPFLWLCAVVTLIGAVLFYTTGRFPAEEDRNLHYQSAASH